MSSSSRLQFATDDLVRTRKLGAVEYAAGQSILYGATCPGRDVTITIAGGVAKDLDLLINKPRCPYLWIAFKRVSISGFSGAQVSLRVNGVTVVTLTALGFTGAVYVHRHAANGPVFPLMQQTDIRAGIHVDGSINGSLVVRDLVILGTPTADLPPFNVAAPNSTS